MSPRILFNTYPVAFDCPGGGEVQLLQSQAALLRAGAQVLPFDVWKPQFDWADIVHHFSVQRGSVNFCGHVKRRGLPLVISPILWLTDEALPTYPLEEIRELLTICDRILPNSQAEADQLSSFFGVDPDKFTVTYNGIDQAFLERADPSIFRRRFGIDGPFLLNVANVEPRKNQVRLARAVRHLDLPLVIVGHVRDRGYFEECIREGRDRVRYLGHVGYASELLRSAYCACAVFVLPSLLETPGLAALEAAAQGAKIVITRIGCTREYFGDAAIYVDPADEHDIRAGITRQLEGGEPGLAESVARRFTWDATAQQLLRGYDRATAFRKAA